MYLRGEGVPQDEVQSFAWFNIAAAAGYKDAEEMKATIRSRMTAAQVAEAQRLSSVLFNRIESSASQ